MESYQLNQTIRTTAELLGCEQEEAQELWNQVRNLPLHSKRVINPLEMGIHSDENKSLGFFIAGLRSGLFVSRWNVVCPICGSVVETQEALQHFFQDSYTCPVCESPVQVDLDSTVEVTFCPSPAFFPENHDPFSGDQGSYQEHYLSSRYLRAPELRDYISQNTISFSLLGLWEFGKVSFQCKAGETFRIINMETRSTLLVQACEVPSPKPSFLDKMIKHLESTGDNRPIQTLETDLKDEGFVLKIIDCKPGKVELWVHNQIEKPVGLQVLKTDWTAFRQVLGRNIPHAKKVLTGKRLVTDQSFRDFLLNDGLPADFRMSISGLTILFTNLHDSVNLFRTLGDEAAYDHIQNHYTLISKQVRTHHGAVVKTMGDQVMAVFSFPQDGFLCALGIQKSLEEYNISRDIGLKIQAALHEDKALAVKANRTLDFFGSSINKGAKLLQHTKPGEIWLTGRFMENPATMRLPGKLGFNSIQHQVILDGVSPELVYQCLKSE